MKTLMVAVPDDVYERAERRAARLGLNLDREFVDLVRRFSENEEAQPAGRLPNRAEEICHELAVVTEECRLPNWDGHGAVAVSPDTLLHAQRFVKVLPSELLNASAGVEADGHLTLEWYREPRWTLSMSISPESNLYYAALFGTSDVRGRESFQADVPEMILNLIRRTFPA